MKRMLLVMLAAGFAAGAFAQDPPQDASDHLPPVQAPPPMDEPGSVAVPPATPIPETTKLNGQMKTIPLANSDEVARTTAAAQKKASDEALAKSLSPPSAQEQPANKPLESPGLPPEVQKAAEATELPVITVRQNGNETIEEYRKRGKLYFVRVQPTEGPTRFYVDQRSDIPPDIRQMSAPSGVVQPVYYKLLDWK